MSSEIITLRDYQDDIIRKAIRYLFNGECVLVASPTGSGKSNIANIIIYHQYTCSQETGIKRVLILSPQTTIRDGFNTKNKKFVSNKLGYMNTPISAIPIKGYSHTNDKMYCKNIKNKLMGGNRGVFSYCMQSFTNSNSDAYNVFEKMSDCSDILLIVDEAHHIGDNNVLFDIVNTVISKGGKCVCFTATPFSSKGDLYFIKKHNFRKIIRPLSVHMEEGYCPKLVTKRVKMDLEKYKANRIDTMAEYFVREYDLAKRPKALVHIATASSVDYPNSDEPTKSEADIFISKCLEIDPSITFMNSIGHDGKERVKAECSQKTYHDVVVTCANGKYAEGTDDKLLCALFNFTNSKSPILNIQLPGRILRQKDINYMHSDYIDKSLMVNFTIDEDVVDSAKEDLRYIIRNENPFASSTIPPIVNFINNKLKPLRDKHVEMLDSETVAILDEIEDEIASNAHYLVSKPNEDSTIQVLNEISMGTSYSDLKSKYDKSAPISELAEIKIISDNIDKLDLDSLIVAKKKAKSNHTKIDAWTIQLELLATKYADTRFVNNTTIIDSETLKEWSARWGESISDNHKFSSKIIALIEHKNDTGVWPMSGDLYDFRETLSCIELLSRFQVDTLYDDKCKDIVNNSEYSDSIFHIENPKYRQLSSFLELCEWIGREKRLPTKFSEIKYKSILSVYYHKKPCSLDYYYELIKTKYECAELLDGNK